MHLDLPLIGFSLVAHNQGYVVEAGDTKIWGRNHNPAGAMAPARSLFLSPHWLQAVPPGADGGVSDEETLVECITWKYDVEGHQESLDAIRATSTDGRRDYTVVISRDNPLSLIPAGRLMYLEEIDEATQTHTHTYPIQHAVHRLVIRTAETAAFTYEINLTTAYLNARGGSYVSGTLGDFTHWIPLNEVELHLVGTQDGRVYYNAPLADQEYDMRDGDYAMYRDMDKNGHLNPEDRLVIDIGPGLEVQLYDTLARAYAMIGDWGALLPGR